MATVDYYFRDPAGNMQRLSLDEDAVVVVPPGWTPEADGAAMFAASGAAAETAYQDVVDLMRVEEHSNALRRQAVLQVIVDTINTANPAADLTVEALVDALSGTPADWQTIPDLLP